MDCISYKLAYSFFAYISFTLKSGKQNTSIISHTKLFNETLENINVFPFINLVVTLIVEFFL